MAVGGMVSSGEGPQLPDQIVIVGPPAAGKTTVARLIADSTGGRCCALTELARTGRQNGWLDPHMPAVPDTSGAFAESTVIRILTAALDHNELTAGAPLTVLDDVISTGRALEILASANPNPGTRLHVVELHLRELFLAPRASASAVADIHNFVDRLQQYREHRHGLKEAASRHNIAWTRIYASPPPEHCAAQALKAIGRTPAQLRARPRKPPGPRDPSP